MQRTRHGRCYSEFLTSGFRAMTERRPTSYISTVMSFEPCPSPPTRRRNSRRISNWRSSIIMPSSRSTTAEASSEASSEPSRRSSTLSISRLFDRRKFSVSSADSLTFSTSPRGNNRELFGTTEITEVWITAGGPYIPRRISQTSEDLCLTIDPFASSPDSKSFFTELSESTGSASPAKRGSFLSFSSDHSCLPLPRLRHRDRPSSMQTMSSPTRSRCSSDPFRPVSWTRLDPSSSSASEEGESADLPLVEDAAWVDPAWNVDWRQFHIELLREEAV